MQTIHIRRFLREIEHDALLVDRKLRASYSSNGGRPIKDDLKNLIWTDDDTIGDVFQDAHVDNVGAGHLDNSVNTAAGDGLQMNTDSISPARPATSNQSQENISSGSSFQ